MILISHRGNLFGKKTKQENHPEYILDALSNGYNVEIDVWFKNKKFYLGHDKPQHIVTKKFLLNKKLWCHAKNADAIYMLDKIKAHYFWHQKDDYTLTSKGIMWVYPGKKLFKRSICVLLKKNFFMPKNCLGICSDYIGFIKGKKND